MFSPLAPTVAARVEAPHAGWRATLKRTADRALAFVTLEGYDTDDVCERVVDELRRGGAAATSAAPTSATVVPALPGPAALPARSRPTDPHAATDAAKVRPRPARHSARVARGTNCDLRTTAPSGPCLAAAPMQTRAPRAPTTR